MSHRKRRGIWALEDPEYRHEVVSNTVAALVVVAIILVITFVIGVIVILVA